VFLAEEASEEGFGLGSRRVWLGMEGGFLFVGAGVP
jgi:hypothetical protein